MRWIISAARFASTSTQAREAVIGLQQSVRKSGVQSLSL